jgi:hypothetical protein
MTYVTINHCKFLIFADDLKIFGVVTSPHECLSLQSDVNSVSDVCAANSMRLIIAKTSVMPYFKEDGCSEIRVLTLPCYH